ncbi:MAG: carbohydrate-binding family 9-like protein [Verrucomicrobiota bacterium]
MRTTQLIRTGAVVALMVSSLACGKVSAQSEFLAPAVRTDAPPTIDGDLSDPCWRQAPKLSNFRLIAQNRLATQQTISSMAWDDQALYLGITCQEKALEPAVQKAHLVKITTKNRDGNVFSDDCVEIFLSPDPAKGYYHFAVNAAGTLYDGRGTDSEWNTDWRAAAKIGDGAWTVEIAIPFKALSATPPVAGARWRFNVCRAEKPESENSSLCGIQGAFHAPEQFGGLIFTGILPAVSAVSVSRNPLGHACASLTVATGEGAPVLEARLETRSGDKTTVADRKSLTGVTGKPEKIELAAGASAGLARLILLENGKEVLATLWEEIGGANVKVPHRIEAHDCEVQVFLRGKQVGTVPAGGTFAETLALEGGVNVIALHCHATGPKPWVKAHAPGVDGQTFSGWRARDGFDTSFAASAIDLNAWSAAGPSGNGFWFGDATNKEVTLRRIIYVAKEAPRNWPGMSDFTLPEGTAQVFYPLLEVPGGVPLNDYRVRLDIPAALRVVSVDEVAGTAGQILKDTVTGERRSVEIGVENPSPGGIELSICWADTHGATIGYVPAIDVGGTMDWRLVRGTLTAPRNACFARLLLIKWQDRGTRGTAWFDNLIVRKKGAKENRFMAWFNNLAGRKKGAKENLFAMGTFEEPWWQAKGAGKVIVVERDGQKTSVCKLVGTDQNEKGQDALWVGDPVPVEAGAEYEFAMLAKCENVTSSMMCPRLALLVKYKGAPLQPGLLRFGFVTAGGYAAELPAEVALVPLPALLKKQPKESRIIPCYYSDMFNTATSKALVQNVWDAGIGAIYGKHNRITEALRPKGFQVIWSFAYNSWQIFPAPDWKDTHPDRLAVNFQEKPDKGRICPTYALQDGNEFLPLLQAWVRETVKDCGYNSIDCDYEVPVVDPPLFCFCTRCLEDFRKREKIPADVKLTSALVVEKYRDAWVAFRCWQNAEMIGLLARFIRETEPKMGVSTYSGYQTKHTREHYGIDWSLLRDKIDEGIAGYNGGRQGVAATAQALAPKPFISGEMYYLGHRTSEAGPIRREGWKMRLVRAYINGGCNGVLIWWLPPMDGSAYYQTSQATAIIADLEDFFRKGQRADEKISFADKVQADDYAAFEKDGQILLVLFNPNAAQRSVDGITVKGWSAATAKQYDDRAGRLDKVDKDLRKVAVESRDLTILLLRQK